uniref:Uncharacterized protein n=1 Tax=Arundo donax TaxID=35708 RepID=A0A0A9BPX8_ARUDO
MQCFGPRVWYGAPSLCSVILIKDDAESDLGRLWSR